ncbi:MAG: hypothetical protein ACE5I1_11580 [bacterium]
MSKIIIGVHGLGNKPPKKILENWWKQAICEGLRVIGRANVKFNFELVYWSDAFYSQPLNIDEKDKKNPLYIEEPYIPADYIERKEPSKLRRKVLDFLEKQLDSILLRADLSLNFSSVTDLIVRHFFKDLNTYFCADCQTEQTGSRLAKDVIRERLVQVLAKHKKKEIMLLAHSMGSIIAYDVLTQHVHDFHIDTFVTLGSPLGLPVIMSKIAAEQGLQHKGMAKLTTPENVARSWCNFADLFDKIAFNYDLADDYAPNTHNIHVVDYEVDNNYRCNGSKNPHKAFGYLRTPELAGVVHAFLIRGRPQPMIWLQNFLQALKSILIRIHKEKQRQ